LLEQLMTRLQEAADAASEVTLHRICQAYTGPADCGCAGAVAGSTSVQGCAVCRTTAAATAEGAAAIICAASAAAAGGAPTELWPEGLASLYRHAEVLQDISRVGEGLVVEVEVETDQQASSGSAALLGGLAGADGAGKMKVPIQVLLLQASFKTARRLSRALQAAASLAQLQQVKAATPAGSNNATTQVSAVDLLNDYQLYTRQPPGVMTQRPVVLPATVPQSVPRAVRVSSSFT